MIVVVSDVHLLESRPTNWPENWDESLIDDCTFSEFPEDDRKSLKDDCIFSKFLRYLAENQLKEGGDLVLLGDFIDLWRSDFVQISQDPIIQEIICNLMKLVDKNVRIHCIAGNHDYGLLKFNESLPSKNPFGNVVKSLRLPSGVFFTHGYQLEVLTWEVYKAIDLYEWFAEKFCLTDAKIGSDASEFWKCIHPQISIVKSTESTEALEWPHLPHIDIKLAKELGSRLNDMGKAPEERFEEKDLLGKIRTLAASKARCLYPGMGRMEVGDVLVFGHTHSPYCDPGQNVVNTGSWNKKPCEFYCFVEIDDENGQNITCKNFDIDGKGVVTVDCEKLLGEKRGK